MEENPSRKVPPSRRSANLSRPFACWFWVQRKHTFWRHCAERNLHSPPQAHMWGHKSYSKQLLNWGARFLAQLRSKIPPNSMKQIITWEEWQWDWLHKLEATSSSQSGLHFGHYISGAASEILSDVHAQKTLMALHHGIALSRWKAGLCVMLEKVTGLRLISKLQAILLMEVEFNAANKIIFSWQLRSPAALALVDAANCYNRVAHSVASLIFRAFGALLPMTLSMLTAIQQMQFFLCTAFGDSDRGLGSWVHLRMQGFMQGNGASPAGWTMVSIVILHAHKQQGHRAIFHCPVSGAYKDLSCILYVDNNDLIHLCSNEANSVYHVHVALQASVTSWGNLLIVKGGSLMPQKYFYYLIGYEWDNKGNWSYMDTQDIVSLAIMVLLPDSLMAPIQQHSVHSPSTTLGGLTSPLGLEDSLQGLSRKALEWAQTACNSGLRPRDFHISVARNFMPKLRYGLCVNTSNYEALVSTMHHPYYWMAPLGWLIWSAKWEICFLDTGFYGLGFSHYGGLKHLSYHTRRFLSTMAHQQ